jgi:AraC-like DNA-binding protein
MQYCRVRRFLRVLKRVCGEERPNWAQVALDCGYYDQPHLTRDFQRYAGVSPSVYVRDRIARLPTYLTLPNVDTPAEAIAAPA